VGERLQRTFSFPDFPAAMDFVNRVADLAEELQHHPDIMIRYSKVTLSLETHDAGGLTDGDFTFARATDDMVATKEA
jgi:4a-hydroxytetrahydrobiopterin dehydratase